MQLTTFPHWATWQHISGVFRGSMSATTRPWAAWQGWVAAHADAADRNSRRRSRLSLDDISDLRDLKVDWSRLPRPEITFYTPNQIRHLIRFNSNALPTSGWLQRDPAAQWRLADISHYQLPPGASVAPAPPADGHAHAHGHAHAWLEGAARGLPLGAVVLVLLVLIARVADKCLDTSFFRRRRSTQRPAADVTDTNNADTNATAPADLPHNERNSSGSTATCASAPDLPPPYSECTLANTVNISRKLDVSPPPPPYNLACYVSYSNPKTGMPSVHFYNSLFGTGAQTNRPRLRSPNRDLHIYGFDADTEQTPSSEDSSTSCEGGERNLVFENGRVLERGGPHQFVNDQNTASDNSSSDDPNVDNGDRKPTRNSRGVFIA